MTGNWAGAEAPGEDVIADLAEATIAALPAPYRDAARGVAMRIADFASDDMLDALGIDDGADLTGLYEGIPLTEKSVMDQADRPDAIWLFRLPILYEWTERGDVTLGALVAHVLVHELAHHFGWSDAEIARIDRWWE